MREIIDNGFPLKPIKRILKKYYYGEISRDVCIYVRDSLLDITNKLAENAVKEFEQYNLRREQQGLYRIKRLNIFVFQRCMETFFKPIVDINNGEEGRINERLLCQDGGLINKKGENITAKNADVEVV